MLAALSTGHKVGMLVVAGIFIAFALASSFVFPRYWPQFPGARGRAAYIVVSIVVFAAMLLAVEFFAVEEEEAEAGAEPAAVEEAPAGSTRTVTVSGTEFAFALSATELAPGATVFELKNEGRLGHDLAVEGPGVEGAQTPVIDPGETAELKVELQPGEYELYCSVPGHRDAGMEAQLKVG